MKHELLMYVQKLEKAMHMPERRNSFGQDVVEKINSLLDSKNISPELRASAQLSLVRYFILKSNELNLISLPENTIDSLESIVTKRRSVRNFSTKDVDMPKVLKAINLASQLPSACNRQPCEVVLIKDKELKNNLLQIHCGNAGFGHLAPLLAVITFDNKAFFQKNEKNSGFLHAGLFSSGFILALEAQGINSCMLNWHVNSSIDKKANKLLGLDDARKIALLILIGYSNGKPEAFSYKEQDIYKIIG